MVCPNKVGRYPKAKINSVAKKDKIEKYLSQRSEYKERRNSYNNPNSAKRFFSITKRRPFLNGVQEEVSRDFRLFIYILFKLLLFIYNFFFFIELTMFKDKHDNSCYGKMAKTAITIPATTVTDDPWKGLLFLGEGSLSVNKTKSFPLFTAIIYYNLFNMCFNSISHQHPSHLPHRLAFC